MIFAASTPAQRSYALGFLAHYAADSVMHPYVAFQCGPQGQFNIPEGHGFCEVAMDSMFHEQDCGSPAVPAGTAAPGLPPQELAEVTQPEPERDGENTYVPSARYTGWLQDT